MRMTEEEREYVIDRYNKLYEKHGFNNRAVGYGSKGDRFNKVLDLTTIDNTKNWTLLDVGCGLADMYPFFIDICPGGIYIGTDINSKYINEAKRRYPEIKDGLFVSDIYRYDVFFDNFDWVVAMGIFCHRLKETDNIEYIKNTIKIMFDLCNEGLVVTFLKGSYGKDKNSISFGLNMIDAEVIAKEFSDNIKVKNSISSSSEFGIAIYK